MQERTERKAVLTGMTFAIVVGFAFLANKAALTGGGLYDVLTYRFLFALLVLPVVLKISKLSLRIAKKDIPAMLMLCATYLLFLHFQRRIQPVKQFDTVNNRRSAFLRLYSFGISDLRIIPAFSVLRRTFLIKIR